MKNIKSSEQSEYKYRKLFTKCLVPMVLLNNKGIITDCNERFLNFIEIDREDIINQFYEDTVLEPIKKLHIFSKDGTMEYKGNFLESLELETFKSDYKSIWLELRFSVVNINKKPFLHIIFRDITRVKESEEDRIRLERTLHDMNTLIEHAPLGIFILAQNGKILRVNEEARNLFQYREEEFLTSEIFDYFPLNYMKQIVIYYKKSIYDNQVENKIETQIVRKDEKRVDVEISSAFLKISDNLFIQSFISDISERKRYERDRDLLLDQLNESLEYKSIFLAEMSHDLRTPINPIMGFTELLLEESYGRLNETQHNYLNDIYSAAEQLDGLIKSILDISKQEIGKLNLNKTRFSVSPLLNQLKSIFESEYSKKGLYFKIEDIDKNMNIYADPVRFKQILFNLIDNALKFTDTGGITIRVLESDNHWEFQIEDTGIGIKKDDYEVVFREFGRIENDKRNNVPGSGIGLSLTKRLIQMHGGGIWFRSNPGKGTIFYFIIPKPNKREGRN